MPVKRTDLLPEEHALERMVVHMSLQGGALQWVRGSIAQKVPCPSL